MSADVEASGPGPRLFLTGAGVSVQKIAVDYLQSFLENTDPVAFDIFQFLGLAELDVTSGFYGVFRKGGLVRLPQSQVLFKYFSPFHTN